MISLIFNVVAGCEHWLARVFKTTYNTVNIVVYYMLVPLSWTVMFDCIVGRPYTTIAAVGAWIGIFIAVGSWFEQWCDVIFIKSVQFLRWFNRWRWSYVLASVIICVFIPLTIYAVLLILLFK